MASKTFEEIKNKLPENAKKALGESIEGLRNNTPSNVVDAKSTTIEQHSTPSEPTKYGEKQRTVAPTTAPAQGNSSTLSEIKNKPMTATTPPPNTDKPKQTL